jgi:hypothetical protein
MDKAGKLSCPAAVLRIEIRRVTVGTSIDDLNPLCQIPHLLKAANRAKDLFLKDAHLFIPGKRRRLTGGGSEYQPVVPGIQQSFSQLLGLLVINLAVLYE